ncbi:hypothetical protein HAX54_004356, partial [Datura stramonium]|nr:hypothetical protein [Datura stramonium]
VVNVVLDKMVSLVSRCYINKRKNCIILMGEVRFGAWEEVLVWHNQEGRILIEVFIYETLVPEELTLIVRNPCVSRAASCSRRIRRACRRPERLHRTLHGARQGDRCLAHGITPQRARKAHPVEWRLALAIALERLRLTQLLRCVTHTVAQDRASCSAARPMPHASGRAAM